MEIPQIMAFSPVYNPYVRVFSNGLRYLNFKELLTVARDHRFGVVAVNCRHYIIPDAVLEAAWQEKAPVILEIAESETSYCEMPPERLADLAYQAVEKMIAKYGYMVPVALHMDHIQKDVGLIDRAVKVGFSSILADFSKAPVDENIMKSTEVVKKLHPLGVSLELEEGEIGEVAALTDPNIDANIENYYTKVEDAYKLVSACRPDALAIFVGNGHGKYLKEPKIGINRIKQIAEAIKEFNCPIVLHGGSYLSNEVFNQAIDAGAAKVNYATAISDILFKYFPEELLAEMNKAAEENKKPVRKVLYLFLDKIEALNSQILEHAKIEMIEHLRSVMRLGFRASGKAALYNLEQYRVTAGDMLMMKQTQ